MTTTRRYTFTTGLRQGHEGAARVIQAACEQRWWFGEPEVSTEGALTFSFLASARDQWFVHRRATNLAIDAVYAAGGSERDVGVPEWERLPPHQERGYGLLL